MNNPGWSSMRWRIAWGGRGRTAVLLVGIAAGVLAPSSAGAQPAPPTPKPPVTAAPQAAPAQDADRERLKRIRDKLKTVDPSMVIYLDSRGNVAGAGDPAGVVGRAEQAGKAAHPPALELSGFPKDQYDLIDWAATMLQGKIKPRDAIDPGVPEVPPFDLDIVITTKSKFQPDVVFSHKVHTMWLACENCHDDIFVMKAGANEVTMIKIIKGQYCGKCHNGRIAWAPLYCDRCHSGKSQFSISPSQGGGALP